MHRYEASECIRRSIGVRTWPYNGIIANSKQDQEEGQQECVMDLSDRTGVSSLSDSLSVRASTLTSKDNTNTKVDGEKKKR